MNAVMEPTTKLSINLTEGTVQVEGDEAFVRSVYEDFKNSLAKTLISKPPVVEVKGAGSTPVAQITDQSKGRPAKLARKSTRRAESDKPRVNEYKPQFDKDLDLSGLEAVYDAFAPKKHSEKILVFGMFLRDQLKIDPCTANHIFTCYETLKGKSETPVAFVQAFRDAENRTHYIEFSSPQKIEVTTAGRNYYYKTMQEKKGPAK